MQKMPYSKDFKLGILGGGQLGRMLLSPAIDLNIHLSILDPDPEAPCRDIAHHFEVGDFRNADTVEKFGEKCDVVSVEIEHVSVEGLRRLEAKGVKVFPQADVLETVQDKGLQKQFYERHGIATAPFHLVENKAMLQSHLDKLPFALKLRKGGYDGRGVQIIKEAADLANAFDAPCVVEQFVDFKKEIAVIAARNEQGEIKIYPPVELYFNPEANLVELLFAPADISQKAEDRAVAMARKTIEAYNLVGILAVELFLLDNDEVLVNEVAPRPHNSGHQTIEANVTSQYAQHLRAILGFPLGETELVRPAAMVNLLGEPSHTGAAHYEGLEDAMALPGVYVHLYGKALTKPFRKMGHVTITADSAEEARETAMKIKEMIKVKTR